MRTGKTTARAAVIAIGIAALAAPAAAAAAGPAAVHAVAVRAMAANPVAVRGATLASGIIKTDDDAGYVTPPGSSTIKATFKVPHVTCTSTNSGVFPGAFAFGLSDFSGAAAGVWCISGQATYEALNFINNTQTDLFTVNPNDTVTVTVSETATKTLVTLKDVTTGSAASTPGPGGGVTSTLAGTVNASINGVDVGVPKFKSDSFTAVSIGGHPLGSVKPTEVERVNGKTVQLVPTAITGGNAFSVVFKHT
jgi:hypothetical protein